MGFVETLRKQLQEQAQAYSDDAGAGRCANWDAYQNLCGKIRGLQLAEQLLNDLAEKVKKADE
jgi:hypothetical protein